MFIRQTPNRNFKDWLKMPIETKDGQVYDIGEEKPITHCDFVNSVYNDIMTIINKNGHTITYKKNKIRRFFNFSKNTKNFRGSKFG